MIEILMVVSVIVLLAALLLPSVALVRTKAKVADAKQTVRELFAACEVYRNDDPHRHYPPEADPTGVDPTLWILRTGTIAGAPQALELLMECKMLQLRSGLLRDGILVDPWNRPYRYTLRRPSQAGTWSAGPSPAPDWNWDEVRNRTRAWNDRDPSKEAAFPYIWSYGPKGESAAITAWIYATDS